MKLLFIGSMIGSALTVMLLFGMLYFALSGLFDALRGVNGPGPPPDPPIDPHRPVSPPPPRKSN